jgi:hypothetical protein
MSVRWTIKQDNTTLVMPNPGHGASDRDIGAAKNYLRKHSRKADAIFRAKGL